MDTKNNCVDKEKRNKKLKIIQEYLTTDISQSELKIKYKIRSSDFIFTWINQFNIELYQLGLNKEIIDKRKVTSDRGDNLKLINLLNENIPNSHLNTISRVEKYKIIEEYLSSPISQSELASKYKIRWRGAISRWLTNIEKELTHKIQQNGSTLSEEELNILKLINNYNKTKKTVRRFDKAFKEKLVDEYHKSSRSLRKLSKKYNLNSSLISMWVKTISSEKENLLTLEIGKNRRKDYIKFMSVKDENEESKIKVLQSELDILKEEYKKSLKDLEYEKFKSTAYSTLIDVAEKELKISIRKKLDVRQ